MTEIGWVLVLLVTLHVTVIVIGVLIYRGLYVLAYQTEHEGEKVLNMFYVLRATLSEKQRVKFEAALKDVVEIREAKEASRGLGLEIGGPDKRFRILGR